jgi:hypothetical protein
MGTEKRNPFDPGAPLSLSSSPGSSNRFRDPRWSGSGTGTPGKSAYEVAVDNGFVGTEADWLASLVGADGADGADGAAATIAVGTVTTVPYGSPATVTNTGTSSAAVFDFEIPRGQTGASGSGAAELLAVDCDATVFVGAAVILTEGTPVDSVMSDWTNLFFLSAMNYQISTPLAVNAQADSMANSNVIGIVKNKPTSTTCDIGLPGLIPGLYFSLEVLEDYYLSDTIPGLIVKSSLKPSDPGTIVLRLGQATNNQDFLFDRFDRVVNT